MYPVRSEGVCERFRRSATAGLLVWWVVLAVGCSDESSTNPRPDTSPDVVDDANADSDVDNDAPAIDVSVDADDDALGDVGQDADVGVCPGSISCFDPVRERPRASICVQAGFETGTSCDLIAGGTEACCVPPFRCETNADCEAAREGEGFCDDERFDCVCNQTDGSCSSFVCLTDEECGGEDVCRGGTCEPIGDKIGLVAHIVTPSGVIAEGETRQLLAVAIDPSDPERVFDNVTLTWSSDSSVVSVDGDGLAEGGSATGSAIITARVASNDSDPGDRIALHNYAGGAGSLRVITIDESTREPVAGALVYIEPAEAEAFTLTTDDDGVVEVERFAGTFDVSVFSADHAYVTHVGLLPGDIVISAPPVAWAEVTAAEAEGGVDRICEGALCYELIGVGAIFGEPDFTAVANSGEIEVTLSGFALANGLLDLSFELIVGPNVNRDLSDGPIPVEGLTEIPGGVTLAFNESALVGDYVLTSTPGDRILWTLGGRVSLSDNPTLLPDIIEQIGGNIDISTLIAVVLPLFDNFYSGITAPVPVAAPDDDGLNLAQADAFLDVPVSRRLFVSPPTVPSTEAGSLETGIFLAGALVTGQGFLPLGITAAADGAGGTPVDGVLDGDTDDDDVDPISLNYSPLHGGIQGPGTQYVLVSVALPLDDSGGDGQGENSSGLITRAEPGEPLPELVEFDVAAFPAFPEGTAYEVATRTLTIVANEDFEADFYRVLFQGEQGRNWLIHFQGGVTSYVLPDPTTVDESLEDRTARLKISVLSVGLDDENPAEPTYASLLALGGPTLDNLVDFVSAFAVLEVEATLPVEE